MSRSPQSALTLADWRARVAQLYAEVRASPDPAEGHRRWREGRAELFGSHPQSPTAGVPELRRSGVDARVDPVLREFLYLPFMHSEHLADQLRCIELSREAGLAESAKWTEHHADIIRRFGRFPHRNRLLGSGSRQTIVKPELWRVPLPPQI